MTQPDSLRKELLRRAAEELKKAAIYLQDDGELLWAENAMRVASTLIDAAKEL